MTLTTPVQTPATSTGAVIPIFALPQGELLTVNVQDIPLIKDAVFTVWRCCRSCSTTRRPAGK